MVAKRALLLCCGDNDANAEIRKFIEDAGIILEVRDIEKKQLTADELNQIIGHVNIVHFINTLSESYTKCGFDKNIPSRNEVLELMAKDHTLIRCPIVKSSRLLTVGCDQRRIAEMLQINADGQAALEPVVVRNFNRPHKSSRAVRPSRK